MDILSLIKSVVHGRKYIYEFPSYLRWRIADKIKLNLCKSPDHLNFTLFRFEEYLLNLIKP